MGKPHLCLSTRKSCSPSVEAIIWTEAACKSIEVAGGGKGVYASVRMPLSEGLPKGGWGETGRVR